MNKTSSTQFEWVSVSPNKVIIASANEVTLRTFLRDGDPFAETMTGAGDIKTTQQLLDGVMAVANLAIVKSESPPKLTPNRLVWQLAGAYHITNATPSLMKKASQHFATAARDSLCNWAAEKVKEEADHDHLALLDIQSLGYRAEELVKNIIPATAISLVNYFTCSVNDSDPIDCVGYAYALERFALGAKSEHIQKIEDALPSGINATRYLRLHSSLGVDGEHVEKNLELIAGLMANERIRIARSCYETALMLFSPPSSGYPTEEELEQIFEPFKLNDCIEHFGDVDPLS